MATDDQLSDFVRDSLARGLPRPQIEQALLQAGWSRDRARTYPGIARAMAEQWGGDIRHQAGERDER